MAARLFCFFLFLTCGQIHASCESEALPLSREAQIYLRLVRVALSESDISSEDIESIILSGRPGTLVVGPTLPKNIELRRKLREVAPRILGSEWPHLVKQLQELQTEKSKKNGLRADAKSKTAPIFLWKSLGHKLKRTPGAFFTTSDGEIFFTIGGTDGTQIHRIGRPEVILLEGHAHKVQLIDFYKAKSGANLFASIGDSNLKIVNLDTGKEIYSEPAPILWTSRDAYRPMLSEENGKLKVAYVPNIPFTESKYSHGSAVAIIDVESKTFEETILPSGYFDCVRTPNGSVMAIGFRSLAGPNNKIESRYLIGDGEVLTGEYPRIPTMQLDQFKPTVFQHEDQLHFAMMPVAAEPGFGYIYNKTTSTLELIGDFTIPEGWNLTLDQDSQGRLRFAMTGTARDSGHILLGEIRGSSLTNLQNLDLTPYLNNRRRGLLSLQFFKTRDETYVTAIEDESNVPTAIHMVDLASGGHRRVELPPRSLQRIDRLLQPIYNPRDGSYIVFANVNDATNEWELFQFYGPE